MRLRERLALLVARFGDGSRCVRIGLEFSLEGLAIDPQDRGGLALVALHRGYDTADVLMFEFVELGAARDDLVELERTLITAGNSRGKIGGHNQVVTAEDQRVLDRVVQLADVAGPRISEQAGHRFGVDGRKLLAGLAAGAREEMLKQNGNVLGALAQGGIVNVTVAMR